jgi:hypothetical protein
MKVKAAPLADAAFRKGAKCGRQALLEEESISAFSDDREPRIRAKAG